MKKILFVMPALYGGGAEKSLVNLLNLIDYKKYAVDLLLFKQEGLFLTQIPKGYDCYRLRPHYGMPINLIWACLVLFRGLKQECLG